MSNTSITNVEITDTFQVWISKTNEVIDTLNENVMLAGPGAGFTVEGNSTLVGTFASTNLNATAAAITSITTTGLTRASDITLPIDFFSPARVVSNQETLLTLQAASGSRSNLLMINGANSRWELGQTTAAANSPFTIRVPGATNPQLALTQTGNLTVSGTITSTGSLNGNLTGNVTGNVTGNLTGNVTGNVTGTVSSLSNHTTNSLAEGTTNLYFTQARARTAIPTVQGTGVSYDSATGIISIGQPVAIGSAVTFASVTTSANIVSNGIITATGAIRSLTGDITAFASSSDIRKKENIVRIDNALDKVSTLGGYTYNFKGDDRRIAGVIAQELELVLPEVVYEVDDEEFGGKTKAVRYGNIVGLLIEAIKELKAELDTLKAK